MLEVDAVLFDLDNTLFDRMAVVRRYWQEVLESAGVGDDPALCERLVRLDTGGRGRLPALLETLGEHVVGDAGVLAEVRVSFPRRVVSRLSPCPETLRLARGIARRYRTGVLTDGNPVMQGAKLEALGLEDVFDVVVLTSEVGTPKPGRAAFDEARGRLGVGAGRTLMVGDDAERDIAGAASAGLRTCWLRRGVSIPVPPDADFVIRDLSELLGVLSCSTPRP